MDDLLESFSLLDEEVKLFEAYDRGYFALLNRGPRLDILRVFNFQPDIEDFDDYPAYMLIQAAQGFFALRQDVVCGKPRPWRVRVELRPRDPNAFFAAAFEHRDRFARFVRDIDAPSTETPSNE